MTDKKWNSEKSYKCSLFLLSVLFFTFAGHWGHLEMRDTEAFLTPGIREGVMPIYPLYLNTVRCIFGDWYLDAASFLQGIIAAVCLTVFVSALTKLFPIKKREGYLLWIACLLPFSVELPDHLITNVIFTEGISYAFYYLYVLCLLYMMFREEKRWCYLSFFMASFMSLMRPQLLLLYILWALLTICLYVARKKKKAGAFIKSSVLGILGILSGVILTYSVRALYTVTLDRVFIKAFSTVEEGTEGDAEKAADKATAVSVSDENEKISLDSNTAQFGSAIIVRGFFEADAADEKYYKTEEMKEIFRKTYQYCDEKGYSYRYARPGLYMWEDLTKSYIYDEVGRAIADYCQETGDTTPFARQNSIKLQLGITEILVHPFRFLYHSFRLMIPGFISCVFFNIESIYLLCHIITLFLYVSAIAMAAFAIKNKKGDRNAGKFMLMVILGCIVFVGITNLLFYGMQRYFLYQMGIFYCAYYLVFRNLCLYLAETEKGQRLLEKFKYFKKKKTGLAEWKKYRSF